MSAAELVLIAADLRSSARLMAEWDRPAEAIADQLEAAEIADRRAEMVIRDRERMVVWS